MYSSLSYVTESKKNFFFVLLIDKDEQMYGFTLHAVKNILAMISYHHQLQRSMGHIFGKKKRCFRDPAILSKKKKKRLNIKACF